MQPGPTRRPVQTDTIGPVDTIARELFRGWIGRRWGRRIGFLWVGHQGSDGSRTVRTRRHCSLTVRYRVRKGSNRRDSLHDALIEATSSRVPGSTATLSTPALSRCRAEAGRRMYGDGSDTFPAQAPELSTRPFVSVTAGEVNNVDVAKVHDTPGGTLGRASLLASRYAHMCMTVVALREPRLPRGTNRQSQPARSRTQVAKRLPRWTCPLGTGIPA